MRHVFRTTALLLAVPFLLLAAVMIGANTDPGRRLIEILAARSTHGTVRISGLTGRFPDDLSLGGIQLTDASGPWLTIEDARLAWSPSHLFRWEASIDRLEARRVILSRLPAPPDTGAADGGTMSPPRVTLRRLHLDRLEIAAAIAGEPLRVTVDGAGAFEAPSTGHAIVNIARAEPRPDGETDRYSLEATFALPRIEAKLHAAEGANGVIANYLGMPDLGALVIEAAAIGPMTALATKATATAGQLRASIDGIVNAAEGQAGLTLSAAAPAMSPAPGLGWTSVRLDGRMRGKFTSPEASGTLTIDDLNAAGVSIGSIQADLAGTGDGQVILNARLDRVRLPGPSPALLAKWPVMLDATAQLSSANRPIRFRVRHGLISAEGTADTGGAPRLTARIILADIAPFATIAGLDLAGRAALNIDATKANDAIEIAAKGTVAVTGGMAPVPALVGESGSVDIAASLRGHDIRLNRFVVSGRSIDLAAGGEAADNRIMLDWTSRLSDLAALHPGASGSIEAKGRLTGTPANFSVVGDLIVDAAAQGIRPGRIGAHIEADGFPGAPRARLTADGSFLDAPLTLAVEAGQRGPVARLTIQRADWKSLSAVGVLDLMLDTGLPSGDLRVSMTDLGDLTPLVGRRIAGGMTVSVKGSPAATRIAATLAQTGVPGTGQVAAASLDATILDLTGSPRLDGTLTLKDAVIGGLRGSARLTGQGPLDAVALILAADIADMAGAPARLESAGTLNATGAALSLASLRGTWKKEAVALLSPVRIGFAGDLTADRLRLGLHRGELDISGRVGDTLDLRARLLKLPADVAAILDPSYAADGTIDAEARLTGRIAAPEGTVHVKASGIRMRTGSDRGLPILALTADAALGGGAARIDSLITAGPSRVTVQGTAPLSNAGRLDLRIGGAVDLRMLEPLVAAEGRSFRGHLALDLTLGGTLAAPRPGGMMVLTGGSAQDFGSGLRASDIAASIRAEGDTIWLTRLSGKAGSGTISANGSIGLAGTHAIGLALRTDNARLLSSDLATASVDSDLRLSGSLDGLLSLSGDIGIRRADIGIPERLPAEIAALAVREAGAPAAARPPEARPFDIALNLTLDAPGQIYIRGRGLDVELGGRVVLTGTAARIVPQGGFALRQGTFTLGGQSLAFTEGTIDFSGAGLTDPSLKLIALSKTAALTSRLSVSGSVKNPKIALSSVPDLPQDEIVAQLLFNSVVARLSPFQIAQVALALGTLSGVPSPIGDPLDSVRASLGLDRLSVGSTTDGSPALEAGRYLAPGVHVGAKQSASGGQTQATVRIDIAKGLKLETTAGTGSSSATGGAAGAEGTSVGVTYQFEY